MKYCSRCLYPENHPLGIIFDSDGVCSGCRVHEEKDSFDWVERERRLAKILKAYQSKTNSNYDCVIPVSGARDSYFIVDLIKNKYGLNPLLVTYNKHYNSRIGIENISYLRTLLDCDIITLTLDQDLLRRITYSTLEKMGSMYWHCLAGQSVLPVRAAVGYKVPLIIWGAHQGVDQVGMYSHADEVEMTRKYRKEHDLMGFEAEDLVDRTSSISERDLANYLYPHDKEIEKVGVRGVYLNNYIRWDTKAQHEAMIGKYDYQVTRLQRTFDTYNEVDCLHYMGVHDYIKYLKWGYSKVTDHICREIRLKRLTRDEGIKLIKSYELDKEPEFFDVYLKWQNISKEEFYNLINQHRSKDVWSEKNGSWRLKESIGNFGTSNKSVALKKKENCNFITNSKLVRKSEDNQHRMLTQGFVDEKIRLTN